MIKGNCSNCKKFKFIQNKKYALCSDCVYEKNHNGITKFEDFKNKRIIYQQKQKNKTETIRLTKPLIKRSISIKVSEKQKEINLLYKKVCEKIDNERDHICSGCGTNQALSHSHLISREDCKRIGRNDLIYDEKNIVYHCLDRPEIFGCHRKWESKRKEIMSTLKDYQKNLDFISQISVLLYNKLINRE